MRTTPKNSVYRNDKYCEIPKCDEGKYGCANRAYGEGCGFGPIVQPITYKLIEPTENPLLDCGCLPFEYRSHLPNCKHWNINEDQSYYSGCLS